MQALLTKYWSVLLTLLSGAFFVGSWTTARTTATAQAVQAEKLDEVTSALADVAKTEAGHNTDLAVVKAQGRELSDRMDKIEAQIDSGKGKK